MWQNSVLSASLLRVSEWLILSKRNAYVLKRKFSPKLSVLGGPPRKLRRKDFYYEVEADTDEIPKPPLEVVLTKDVAGIGMMGEKVEMDMFLAYRDLLLPKLAVYASSPEAQNILKATKEIHYSSVYCKLVENTLAEKGVEIILSNEEPWKLEPMHVKLALRRKGIFVNSNDCIEIPKEISGPDFSVENKDFFVNVIMNKKEKFMVRCRIFHQSSSQPSLNQKSFNMHIPSEPLFPDQKEIIDLLLKKEEELRKSKMLRGMSNVKSVNLKQG